ncbi:hypothetical protein J2T19_005286 [Paenibacillus tundrae]|uniref:Uncharacterized protein n=1 Tax=Paenibacillus tundrae TaxID=528187 RepID=A0ABT9WKT0_9BACL|nr:hypothetical protein [Paenibacillus tundrae]
MLCSESGWGKVYRRCGTVASRAVQHVAGGLLIRITLKCL